MIVMCKLCFKINFRPVLQSDAVGSGKCPHCGKFPTESAEDSTLSLIQDPLSLTDVANQLQRKFADVVNHRLSLLVTVVADVSTFQLNPIEWAKGAKPYLTMETLVNTVKFIVVLCMAIVSGAAALLPEVLFLLNGTIRECGGVITKMTPFLLGCLDVIKKAIGGFYLLLAMVWRGSSHSGSSHPKKITILEDQRERKNYLEGPRFPYRRDNVQRPYVSRFD